MTIVVPSLAVILAGLACLIAGGLFGVFVGVVISAMFMDSGPEWLMMAPYIGAVVGIGLGGLVAGQL